jgi:glutathione synthase/RimK-type ligase-like ATP-grasp enzyme
VCRAPTAIQANWRQAGLCADHGRVRIALATAIAAFSMDADLAPLQLAFAAQGASAEALAWDDPTVSWSRFDAVLLRSTWDYCERLPDFLAWCERVSRASHLVNPLEVVRWNTDKHYLLHLAAGGVPTVPSQFLEPGAEVALPDHDTLVVKPAVGAGARGAARYARSERAAALAHAQRLLAAGRSVLVQPYIAGVDQRGETALVYIDGHASHAIRKGALLPAGGAPSEVLSAAEAIRPRVASDAEYAVAARVLEALPFAVPAYARVDLLPGPEGPLLLEVELIEPSLFFHAGKGAADRLAGAVLRDLVRCA